MVTGSVAIAGASVERDGGAGEDGVVAGHEREAAEVEAVGELGFTGGELLVAAGGDREGVAGCDGFRQRVPEFERVRGVAFDFHRAGGVGAGGKGELAAGEPTGRVAFEAGGGEAAVAGGGDDGAGG